ncbi:MAG: putative DNA binding domain-containing protein [Candidatus Riflebacteria bacterium]|nr:putative DNA binding domain-containing protein [Candidatus Riflebacteria bacterium]
MSYDINNIEDLLCLPEDQDREYKAAFGGLPRSIWETYSAMANSTGGVIILGVEETGDGFRVCGLKNIVHIKRDFWNTINNPMKVSLNLLSDKDVEEAQLFEKTVLIIRIPAGSRRQRPVFINHNPLTGTFRRNYEGDYHCTPDEVKRMLADQAEEPADSRICEHFTLDDLDLESLKQYRNRFSSFFPNHPWLSLDDKGLLEKLGGWKCERGSKKGHLTAAGLLMFGQNEAIRASEAFPRFHLDYQEKLSDDLQIRWDHRITPDGTWAGNLFQFFLRTISRLSADLRIPFKLNADLVRQDDTLVHQATREALVNTIIHTDFQGIGGIIVRKFRSRFEFSNPGSLLLPLEKILHGGISECRNKSLQTMFQMIGCGEKAGSGIAKIFQGWQSQHWRSPLIEEAFQPERVQVVLPMVTLLPEEAVERLKKSIGKKFQSLSTIEVQALITADQEEKVTNARLQMMVEDHPADISKALQNLVAHGWLEKSQSGRWTSYVLPRQISTRNSDSPHNVADFPHNVANSPHNVANSPHSIADFPHKNEAGYSESTMEQHQAIWVKLMALAEPVRAKQRCSPAILRQTILILCSEGFLTRRNLGDLLSRDGRKLQERFLTKMVRDGLLELKYPDEINRPDQAYRFRKDDRKLMN